VALQGTLDTFALSDVLRLLAATKKSGRLQITGERGTGSVWALDGEIVRIEAAHAPHATEAVDGLFELLRFEEGSFTFDAEATPDDSSQATDLEVLLPQAEALLEEWHSIEAVVPSLDAWVTLRTKLPRDEVKVDQARWTTLVAVAGGATVRRVADELCLAELAISRAVKELVELGLVEISDAPPAGVVPHAAIAPAGEAAVRSRPLLAGDESAPSPKPSNTPTASGARARRARALAAASTEAETFVPLDLPGQGPAPSYDERGDEEEGRDQAEVEVDVETENEAEVDDLAAAFPGLANLSTPSTVDVDDEELAKQLATLSPRAASAIRAAAEATTDDEREAALAAADDDDQPLNRGLLLKFLSSVKS
jgi:DNA-binding MarR family transcriptional regulator